MMQRSLLTALGNLLDTRVFAVEGSDEHGRLASGIHLEVDGALGEDRSGSGAELDVHEASTVFSQEAAAEGGVEGEVNLSRTRVGVGSVYAAGTEETNS